MTADPEYLNSIFEEMPDQPVRSRLAEVAEAGAEDVRLEIISRLDELIWRRKLLDKPHDQLDEIREMVRIL